MEVMNMKNYYVNGWTDKEERTLVNIMMEGMSEGKNVHELFEQAETTIGRSRKACMGRWYSIRHKFLKQIV
jgi:hypothetical protein